MSLIVALCLGMFIGDRLFGELGAPLGRSWEAIILAIAPSWTGLLIWRLEGHRIVEIASWTVPLLVASTLSVYVLTGTASVFAYVFCVVVLATMILTVRGPQAWKRLRRR